MKKIVLLLSLCCLAIVSGAQVICQVQAPSPNEGNYDFTFAETGTWGVPDLNDPANSVLDTMMLVNDGTGLDNPTACVALVNDLTDKVAVLYRGSCEFGTKALNAQNAGARAVIIINNLAGAPVAMGAGADGAAVTIPVVMISNVDGALLRAEIDAGNTEVFIGSKNGLYANDLGFLPGDYLRARNFGNLQQLSQDDTEFEVEMGSWVRNYGTNTQSDMVLTATIELEGSEIYNESSDPATIPFNDSIYVPLPTFSAASYANGYYKVNYTVSFSAADESTYDNTGQADFLMSDQYYSKGALDETTSIPVNTTNQFNGSNDNLYTCLFFQDPNASRLAVKGMNFSAGTSQNPDPTSIDGKFFEFYIYEWNDAWVDLDDAGFAFSNLNDIADAEYNYTSNAQSENVSADFDDPILLEDDQRYLFCAQIYGTEIYPGYDGSVDYRWNVDTYRMPTSPILSSGDWFALGFGTDRNPALSVEMFSAAANLVELNSVELQAYPNPANQIVHIPVEQKDGNIVLTIVDITGKVIDTQNVTMNGPRLDVDVTSFAPGTYVVNLQFEDGKTGTVNLAVSK